ncbi:bifunctional DNA-formamidopyrimidine glycosylase/DNA-(apurinic or apyrimidinic site) lyase [Thalassotalea sp. PS06]|uniref:bifunctional DNA-formamidopyrimidine glycosylase/DNA-(apurinic or apyrimidinic site) lyase n=1 Tax=Thalassotalea sp. PS06 TaxID=2594005 RepID=UPI001163F784|nr:bifunctional DNA-formamidopyrimidine glycosylase/DNA-(apurinic or apyrimidinic site) lyase [Thalassotalea sp. PS06]QDP02555.1 bifunctional DNA-formamidopyrimidine glycosylase/DNA-(apurinic or apyrimidinic site) lyase [Thalassotalea sp. PS06]
MPELPEVEVCRQGIKPHVLNQNVSKVIVRNRQMRWPVSDDIEDIEGEKIVAVERRAKYLLLKTAKGTLLLHLGMSGTIRVIDATLPLKKHDHFDLVLDSGKALRLNDPRRFGAILWLTETVAEHPLLSELGPEPLTDDFPQGHLFEKSRNKSVPVKTFIMNNHVVVGVGNIYANESLFQAGIRPTTPAGKISRKRYDALTLIIKDVLAKAIKQGGTTLKDFTQSDGKPGYFAQELQVYGRGGEDCVVCGSTLKEIKQGGRATVYCPKCQAR